MKDRLELVKIDRNGSKHYHGMVVCDRCGGHGGSDAWQYSGWTCYKCGGTGYVEGTVIVRTPEYEAKLAARRAAKAAARAEEDAKRFAEYQRAEAERKAAEEAEQARIAAEKARSQWVGTVGEKLTTKATFDHTAWFDCRIGWKEERLYIHSFKDSDGNVIVWKTSKGYICDDLNEGDAVTITGTVKDHTEYKDQKQTNLIRCKVAKI